MIVDDRDLRRCASDFLAELKRSHAVVRMAAEFIDRQPAGIALIVEIRIERHGPVSTTVVLDSPRSEQQQILFYRPREEDFGRPPAKAGKRR